MRPAFFLTSLTALILAGCEDVNPPSRPPMAPPGIMIPTAEKPTTPPPPPAQKPAQMSAQPPGGAPSAQQPGRAQGPPPSGQATQRAVADVGVGQKGHYGQGIITTPLDAIWRTDEALAFRVKIKHALDLYKATNDGRGPATHEEFMEKIIRENQIRLPDLPPGHRYKYDPKLGELMVERPAQ